MAYRDRSLLIDSLGSNFAATTTSAGTAAAVASACCSVQAASGHERIRLTQLGWSVRNHQAAGVTMTLQVSHATGTSVPTVLASWDLFPAAAGYALDNFVVNFMGKKGLGLQAVMNTPLGSVTQKVSIAGWRDSLSDG